MFNMLCYCRVREPWGPKRSNTHYTASLCSFSLCPLFLFLCLSQTNLSLPQLWCDRWTERFVTRPPASMCALCLCVSRSRWWIPSVVQSDPPLLLLSPLSHTVTDCTVVYPINDSLPHTLSGSLYPAVSIMGSGCGLFPLNQPYTSERFVYNSLALTSVLKMWGFPIVSPGFMSHLVVCADPRSCWMFHIHVCCFHSALPNVDQRRRRLTLCRGFTYSSLQQNEEDSFPVFVCLLFVFARHETDFIYSLHAFSHQDVSFLVLFALFACILFLCRPLWLVFLQIFYFISYFSGWERTS